MLKVHYCLLEMFGIKLSEKQKKYWSRMGEVKYHLIPKDGRSAEEFLKEHARKLWWRPRYKKIPTGGYLVCLYWNPLDNSPDVLRAAFIDTPEQYDRFVKSVNVKESWYALPCAEMYGNYS